MAVRGANFKNVPGSKVRVCFGRGQLDCLGELAAAEEARRVLLVTDAGIVAAGHVDRALRSLKESGVEAFVFAETQENPTTHHVQAGLEVAQKHSIDFIVGLGGGSSMDCAKGVNFLLTNGGEMRDFRGIDKATKPMLPLIAVPTTAGTGSEAQSFALITDPVTHEKMACGDAKALPRLAILDPDLVDTCPLAVAAATGVDAIAHSVETSACIRRTDVSRALSKEAWRLLSNSLASVLQQAASQSGHDSNADDMLMGAHLAGAAIQNSMLGAAHACANPLTAKFGIVHGIAVGIMLPHVVAFNTQQYNPYRDLDVEPAKLIGRLRELLALAGIPRLRDCGVSEASLGELAEAAALQWTATFNPLPVGPRDLLSIYQAAWDA